MGAVIKKSKYLGLVVLVATSFFVSAQTGFTTIDFVNEEVMQLMNKHGAGKIYPVSDTRGLMIIENGHLIRINTINGAYQEFDEQVLEQALDAYLLRQYEGTVVRYSYSERQALPYCSSNQFQYHRFYEVDGLYACQVDIPLKVLLNNEQMNRLCHFLVFFDDQLRVKEIYEREKYQGAGLFSSVEGFFLDKNNFFVGKRCPDDNSNDNFLCFQRKEDRYLLIGALPEIKESGVKNFFPGRHLTAFKINESIYINDGKALYRFAQDLSTFQGKHVYDLNPHEVIADLKPIDENTLVGIQVGLHPDGAAKSQEIRLFRSDLSMRQKDELAKFNGLDFRLNSMEVYGNAAYLSLYNNRKQERVVHTMAVKKYPTRMSPVAVTTSMNQKITSAKN